MYTLTPYIEESPTYLLYVISLLSKDNIQTWLPQIADVYVNYGGYKITVYSTQETIIVKTMGGGCEVNAML